MVLSDVLYPVTSSMLRDLLGPTFTPAFLFASGEEGAWYDTSDISTLFQDSAGTTPVTASGQTIGFVKDKSGNELNATQATTAARPSYIVDADGAFIQHDSVDDALTVTMPDLGTEATVAYVTRSEVRLLEDQTISGSYTLPAQELANFVVIDRALTFAEKVNLIRFLASKVDGVNYGAEIDRLTLIAINAVDVFVYDTSKDSDGGAWRKRCQHTSWFNETLNTATRGSRREFPAVAVIVAEVNKVTIYDGDDPALPMWMVFNLGSTNGFWASTATATSMFMREATLTVGSNSVGHRQVNFVSEKFVRSFTSSIGGQTGGIINRNATLVAGSPDGLVIVNATVNDVAMTVLPNAPIDPATGLPVPTIAVATNGGVSVIKDDGTVVDATITGSRNYVSSIDFLENGRIFALASNVVNPEGWWAVSFDLPEADIADVGGSIGNFYSSAGVPAVADVSFADIGSLSVGDSIFLGRTGDVYGSGGLTSLKENTLSKANGMVAYTTSTYNTGWMNGDIKGAFLADTDDTDLVGSTLLALDGTDASAAILSSGGSIAVVSGEFEVTSSGGANGASFAFNTVVGKTYVITATVRVGTTGSAWLAATTNPNNFAGLAASATASTTSRTNVTLSVTYVADDTAGYVYLRCASTGTAFYDNISVKLADADRSVNNNNLTVNGTITREPVATGAELVAYSGFSSSNYLEQPYNPDLDFGTGDFCVMGWVKPTTTANCWFWSRGNGSSAGSTMMYLNSSGYLGFGIYTSSFQTTVSSTIPAANAWSHVVAKRISGVIYLYVNGILVYSAANANTVTNSGNLIFGKRQDASNFTLGSLALWRISATAPTAEQIAKIYEDELPLFQENAACTLYGASDAVTALAHDPDTNLLHVGTSAGRSVFDGLRRVGNTTTSVSTAISVSGGLVVEK